ncbi:MAG TPA: class IV adenylate cyclase [Gemmatimonadaceae bacterium]|nr:class IV adenylate cyclase [Gemmatimonadaceae bacterium]
MNEPVNKSINKPMNKPMSDPTREVELKARVQDIGVTRRNIENAGALLVFDGSLHDRIYDTPDRILAARDFVLRLRSYVSPLGVTAHLDWKGPTSREDGFKVRSELTTGVTDPNELAAILDRIGFEIVGRIDRQVVQYEIQNAETDARTVIRFERYPRMDVLVEVEGSPAGIERAIDGLGIPRAMFSADRLSDFVRAFEARTGEKAAVCDQDL